MILVDDHALLRTGVANIINQEPDLHVVAEGPIEHLERWLEEAFRDAVEDVCPGASVAA